MYDAFESVRTQIAGPPHNVTLEHPLITALHDAFVVRGDFNTTEAILSRAAFTPIERLGTTDEAAVPVERDEAAPTLFSPWITRATPKLYWDRLDTDSSTANVDGDAPGPRGGHQLVFCPANAEAGTSACIYLLGGWDGRQDLSDLWRFDIAAPTSADDAAMDATPYGRWTLLSRDVSAEGGPGPRSCHKACFDERTGQIYVLGRFVDCNSLHPDPRYTASAFTSDFYRYHTRGELAGHWESLSDDMMNKGGPPTMCVPLPRLELRPLCPQLRSSDGRRWRARDDLRLWRQDCPDGDARGPVQWPLHLLDPRAEVEPSPVRRRALR
jgi:hypothetical protein